MGIHNLVVADRRTTAQKHRFPRPSRLSRQVVIALFALTATVVCTGCVPPQLLTLSPILLPLLVFPLLLSGLFYGFLVGDGSGFSQVEALFVYGLFGVYLAPFLKYVTLLTRRGRASVEKGKNPLWEHAYAVSVIDAALSSLIVLGCASLASLYDQSLPPATYCALVAFIGFFILNLGYNFTRDEKQALVRDFGSDDADRESRLAEEGTLPAERLGGGANQEVSPEVTRAIKEATPPLLLWKTGQIHYVHFILAPFITVMIWLFAKPHLDILVLNLVVLFSLLGVSIFIHAMVKAFIMASGKVPRLDGASTSEYTRLYLYLSRVRLLFLYDNCHDLAIVAILGFCGGELLGQRDLVSIVRPLVMIVLCLGVFSAFLPFYWGQKVALESVVDAAASDYNAREALRRALLKRAPLYPKALPLTPLLTALGAGGCLTFFVKQFLGTS